MKTPCEIEREHMSGALYESTTQCPQTNALLANGFSLTKS